MKPCPSSRLLQLALAAGLTLLIPPDGQAAEPSCAGATGTYLTKNAAESGNYTSRSLLSFAEGGLALFADSGEGGEKGFAPFSDGQGAWRCVAGDEEHAEIHATTLDFTLATPRKAQIGRLDFDLRYDAATKRISGTATLHLVPLDEDPLAVLKGDRRFKVEGIRVEAQ